MSPVPSIWIMRKCKIAPSCILLRRTKFKSISSTRHIIKRVYLWLELRERESKERVCRSLNYRRFSHNVVLAEGMYVCSPYIRKSRSACGAPWDVFMFVRISAECGEKLANALASTAHPTWHPYQAPLYTHAPKSPYHLWRKEVIIRR